MLSAASARATSPACGSLTPELSTRGHGYDLALRCYGANAILGPLEDSAGPPREVGLLCKVRAGTQQLATAVAKTANPLLLHLPLPGMTHLPSFAFATSPPEMERGASYEFVPPRASRA